jgi:hypothetical protein
VALIAVQCTLLWLIAVRMPMGFVAVFVAVGIV